MSIHQATKMNRRRFTALLGALSLYPTLGHAATEPQKYVCSNYQALSFGTRKFAYYLTEKQPTAMQGSIRVDMSTYSKGPKRPYDEGFGLSFWNSDVMLDNKNRRAYFDTLPASQKRDIYYLGLDGRQLDIYVNATIGWMDIDFATRPNQLNRLLIRSFTFRFPPVGADLSFGLQTIDIKVLVDGQLLFSVPYVISEREKKGLGYGAEPKVTVETGFNKTNLTQQNQQARALVNAIAANKKIILEARAPNGDLLIRLGTAPFDFNQAYKEMIKLQPVAKQKAIKAINGDFSQCDEISDCYLTTASVNHVGLADDCWELKTLRHYRDTYLKKHPKGQSLITDYYHLAPTIVQNINHHPNANNIWLKTYITGILPAAICAKLGLNQTALKIYKKMTTQLMTFSSNN